MASNKTNRPVRKLQYSKSCVAPEVISPIADLAYNLASLSTFNDPINTPKRRISWSNCHTPPDQNKAKNNHDSSFETTTPETFKKPSEKVFVGATILDFRSPLPKGIGQLVQSPLASSTTPKEKKFNRIEISEPENESNCIRGTFPKPEVRPFVTKRTDRSQTNTPQQEPKRQKAFSLRPAKKTLFPDALSRCYSESQATDIIKAVEDATDNPDLVGDFSRPHALPMIAGKHRNLKFISAETMFRLLSGDFTSGVKKHVVIDCRFPYEYEGGHVRGAVNIYSKEVLLREFFEQLQQSAVLIFHCEFSSKRGPSMCRFLRRKDRETNEYPNLFYPEIYVLNGGYKAFFESCKEFCVPRAYKPMVHEDHEADLRFFELNRKRENERVKYLIGISCFSVTG